MHKPDLNAPRRNLAAGWAPALVIAAFAMTLGLAPAVAQPEPAAADQTEEVDFEKIEALAHAAAAPPTETTKDSRAPDNAEKDNAEEDRTEEDDPEVDEKTYLEAVVAASLAVSRGDDHGAFLVYLPLAERGHAEAQYSVGFMMANGSGVERDPTEAIKWYRLAAEQSHETAQLQLGLMLRDGIGTAKDLVRAHMWLSLAATKGASEARAARNEIGEELSADELERSRDMVIDWLRDHKDAD